MFFEILIGILLPFFGTLVGATAVFFLKKGVSPLLLEILNGFAAGVMLAASIWSLLIPSISYSNTAIIPIVGFFCGFFFLIGLDKIVFLLCPQEKSSSTSDSTLLLVLAVALHNLPEGIAVGVVFAEYLLSGNISLYTAALAFSVGITIQNFPEGAIISCPLYAAGMRKYKAFSLGVASGVVEPLGAALAIVSIGVAMVLLPFLLSFTAGAMIYVTIKNLVPEFVSRGKLSGTVFFALGFSIMMLLDITL